MNSSEKWLGSIFSGLLGAAPGKKDTGLPVFESPDVDLPQHALLAITYNCVAACPHCYLLQQDSSVFDGKRVMDEKLFRQILDSPSFSKVSKVTLAGGEALMHPEVFNWLRAVGGKGINNIATITNGLLLQKSRVVEQLMDMPMMTHFNVSLDSDNKEEFCKCKGIKNCDFDMILDSVKSLTGRYKGTSTRVSGSFVRYTMQADDVRRILQFAQSLGFHKVTIHALHLVEGPEKSAGEEANVFAAISEEIMAHTDYGVDVTVKVPVSVAECTFYCPSLAKYMCIGADGMMAPCCHVPWAADYGVFDPEEANAINHSAISKMREKFIRARENADESVLPEPCRNCPKRTRGSLCFNAVTKKWSR